MIIIIPNTSERKVCPGLLHLYEIESLLNSHVLLLNLKKISNFETILFLKQFQMQSTPHSLQQY